MLTGMPLVLVAACWLPHHTGEPGGDLSSDPSRPTLIFGFYLDDEGDEFIHEFYFDGSTDATADYFEIPKYPGFPPMRTFSLNREGVGGAIAVEFGVVDLWGRHYGPVVITDSCTDLLPHIRAMMGDDFPGRFRPMRFFIRRVDEDANYRFYWDFGVIPYHGLIIFVDLMMGPGVAVPPSTPFDWDGDGDVDLRDYASLQRAIMNWPD